MARHAFARLRLVTASAVLAAGLSPLLPSAAVAEVPQETVVPATLRGTYTSGSVYGGSSYDGHDGAGARGVFHSLEGSGLVWTRYADGTSVKVVHPTGYTSYATAGGDVLAYRYPDGRVDLWNASDGTTRTIRTPEGLTLLTAYRDLAVAYRQVKDENGTTVQREMHLLFPEDDGSTRDVPVTGVPEGYLLGQPKGGDSDGLLFHAGRAGGPYLTVMVDRRTGQTRGWTPPRSKVYPNAQVTADHVVLFNISDPTVQVFSRSDLSAAPVEVTVDGSGTNPAQDLAVVGDWLLTRPGTAVIAKPLTGGPSTILLPASNPHVSAASDGSVLAVGRTATAADDWGVQRIQPGPDGSPVVTQVKALPKPPFPIQGLSLYQGRLVVTDYAPGDRTRGERISRVRTVAAGGTPTFGEASQFLDMDSYIGNCPDGDLACAPVQGLGDGQIAWMGRNTAESDRINVGGQGPYDGWHVDVPAGGRITDASGEYLIHTAPGRQSVYRLRYGSTPTVTRTPGAAALSGNILWTTGTTKGSVTAYDLTAKKTTETVTTDAGCTPTELQALGRWLYWTCDGRAGVYDRTAKKSVLVPADEAKLGDGYVVTHDKQDGKLTLTAVAGGMPASRVIGDLPDTGVSQRDVRWTVDESGANAAYVDGQERVHLVPSGVAQQPLRLLESAQTKDEVYGDESHPDIISLTRVLLSKPAASWRLTVRDKATGKVVDTRDGGAVRGELKVGWHGLTRTERLLPNGWYDWTLSVVPADGVGAPLEIRDTVRLLHGSAVRHDHVGGPVQYPDGIGDLLTLNSSGALTFHQGTGKGTFSGKVSGGGWATSVRPVPFGDLSGDRCNDVLVRLSSGALRLYKPGCGAELKPSTSYTTLSTSGWNQYDVLTAPGDVSGDGRPDLIARNASTGTVYLYKGTSTGKLSARVKLYDNWKTYKKIVGVGDLNGDGTGDLLAQDKANTLYRYYGKGNGTFSARTKLFANWGGSYNVIVGVGDFTGDGKADIVSRDTSGNVWRNNGDGKGSFGGRVKIATGWQGYKGLF
ncbi:VCBS repeat-containing protein [Streptomyces sp. NBC_01373]|uniref:FG-GAP repeat domain-containing protein n=1 Tax=Streptomyces sp. NBC_01373 TaxID=2903843 RepID=UPI00224F7D8E|nr:VCBS repeat-containing protein [Streptomyces sp. NBC_01373]MCX4699637.1 VCBS repeat-containing protein [Streptomyces sp. NBC_01373]